MQDGEGVGKRRANFFIVFLWWQTPDNAVEGQNARACSRTRLSNVFPNCFVPVFSHTPESAGKSRLFDLNQIHLDKCPASQASGARLAIPLQAHHLLTRRGAENPEENATGCNR